MYFVGMIEAVFTEQSSLSAKLFIGPQAQRYNECMNEIKWKVRKTCITKVTDLFWG